MVNVPITSLPSAGTVSGTDVVPIVQGGVTKKAATSLIPVTASSHTHTPTQMSGTVVLTSTANQVDLDIPDGYRNLRLWWTAKVTANVAGTSVVVLFNNDTTANNYGDQRGEVNLTTFTGASNATTAGCFAGVALGTNASVPANSPGTTHMNVPGYSNTTFLKNWVGTNFEDRIGTAGGGMRVRSMGGIWRSTAAITTVSFQATSSALFAVGSQFGWEVVDPLP